MMPASTDTAALNPRIEAALKQATDTQLFWLGEGILERAAAMYNLLFPGQRACLVADPNTLCAAGREVYSAFRQAGISMAQPLIFERPPHAELAAAERVRETLVREQAIAVAVGSGSINDICKLASEQCNQGYLCVATAASVDGYTSPGAPMTLNGFKKTVPCHAPRGILADLGVLQRAPYELTAAGYADLMAKVTGGADWIVADVVGADPINSAVWPMVQEPLVGWLNHPRELKQGDVAAFSDLFEGLVLSGFAMQASRSSRPASGCEHLFSHVWEMAGLTGPDGTEPSHGFKVGIGTLSAVALYDCVFSRPFTEADIAPAVATYPTWTAREAWIRKLLGEGEIAEKTVAESREKHLTPTALEARLRGLVDQWATLHERLNVQLMPWMRMREMLRCAGCPTHPTEIGLSTARCGATVIAAQMIRARYTVLDLAYETGRFHEAIQYVSEVWSHVPGEALR